MLESSARLFPKKRPIPKFNRPSIKRTLDMISKVKRLVDRKKPASHRFIKKETKPILSTINKIIHQHLSKDTGKNRMFIIFMTGIRKTAKKDCCKLYEETNPNLRSLWMKCLFMRMKQMYRLEFTMYHAEKPYRMIGYLKKLKVSVRA